MNPRIKHIAFGSSHDAIPTDSKNPDSMNSADTLRDGAALLMSIADICDKEVKSTGLSMLWNDDESKDIFPRFPSLAFPSQTEDSAELKPRLEGPKEATRYPLRPRLVSMDCSRIETPFAGDENDTDTSDEGSVSSPRCHASPIMTSDQAPSIVTPTATVSIVSHRRLASRKQSHRLLKQAKREQQEQQTERQERLPVSGKDKKGKSLQGIPPKGVPIKKIMRKKFSWKNYPEVRLLYSFSITFKYGSLRSQTSFALFSSNVS